MPVLHIALDCSTPTAHADGAYRTLVAVTDAEFRDGVHLREATRRAAILGFGGPYRVLVSRQLYGVTPETPTHPHLPDGCLAASLMSDRLEALLAGCTAPEKAEPEHEASSHSIAAQARQSARRTGIRV